MDYTFTNLKDDPHLVEPCIPLADIIWPPFMHQDPVAIKYWGRLYSDFAEWQTPLMDGDTLVGMGNTVPFYYDDSLEDLPDTGWDWAMETAMEQKGLTPNTLIGLQIMIAPEYQGKGLSGHFITNFKALCKERGLKQIAIPVRPTHKHRYPLTSIHNYVKWTTDEGLPFDPWLRVHVRAGGTIIKPCTEAMTISGTIAEWESWTDMTFPESGDYIIPHALNPVKMNCEKDQGIYIEPNVWTVHHVQ